MGETRNNFKKAMADVFGLDKGTVETAGMPSSTAQPAPAAPEPKTVPEPAAPEADFWQAPDYQPPKAEPELQLWTDSAARPLETKMSDETFISESTVIKGDIESVASLYIKGKVTGNITCDNNILLSGKVDGNLAAKDAFVDGGQVRGNMDMRGDLVVQHNARITGDITSNSLDLDSTVEGNTKTQRKAVIRVNASVSGNLTTQSLVVEEGAIINGYVSMTDATRRFPRAAVPPPEPDEK